MFKKLNNKKGFTLMEMLIVVAIIAILIAIAIPTFSSAMEKAREAADIANIRSAYAQAMADSLCNNADASVKTGAMTQATAGWSYIEIPSYLSGASGWKNVQKGDTVTVKVAQDGTITIS